MIGIDTNILVRLLVNDDKNQTEFAKKLFEKNDIYIPKSVLLETEWVLRYTYDIDSATILESFEKVLALSQVRFEDPAIIIKALEWYRLDFDFADALHLASCSLANNFATFDKKFIKKAKKLHFKLISPGSTSLKSSV